MIQTATFVKILCALIQFQFQNFKAYTKRRNLHKAVICGSRNSFISQGLHVDTFRVWSIEAPIESLIYCLLFYIFLFLFYFIFFHRSL